MRQKDNTVLLHTVEMTQEEVRLPKVALDSTQEKRNMHKMVQIWRT